ncbi:MAG: hypothetical protein LBN05_06755 [Oscillospiraceae bacterium]|jgi:hypothetical protein|nr:hypothetical protein [Oscillospiraceae bacterium]
MNKKLRIGLIVLASVIAMGVAATFVAYGTSDYSTFGEFIRQEAKETEALTALAAGQEATTPTTEETTDPATENVTAESTAQIPTSPVPTTTTNLTITPTPITTTANATTKITTTKKVVTTTQKSTPKPTNPPKPTVAPGVDAIFAEGTNFYYYSLCSDQKITRRWHRDDTSTYGSEGPEAPYKCKFWGWHADYANHDKKVTVSFSYDVEGFTATVKDDHKGFTKTIKGKTVKEAKDLLAKYDPLNYSDADKIKYGIPLDIT